MNRIEEVAADHPVVVRVRELNEQIYTRVQQAKDDTALVPLADEALALADEMGDPRLLAETRVYRGHWHWWSGRHRQALDILREALAYYEDEGIVDRHHCQAHNSLGLAYCGFAEFPEALHHHGASYELAVELEHSWFQQRALVNIGATYLDAGLAKEAIYCLLEAAAADDVLPRVQMLVHQQLAYAYVLEGVWDQAEQHAVLACGFAAHQDAHVYYSDLSWLTLATVFVKQGLAGRAREALTNIDDSNLHDHIILRYWLLVAELRLVEGRHAEAIEACQQTRQRAEALGHSEGVGWWHQASMLEARVHLDQGALEASQRVLESIVEDELPYLERGRLCDLKVELYSQRGDWYQAFRALRHRTDVGFVQESGIELAHRLAEEVHRVRSAIEQGNEIAERNNLLVDLASEKNEMLRIVSHDLRNPITRVRLSLELLTSDDTTGPGPEPEPEPEPGLEPRAEIGTGTGDRGSSPEVLGRCLDALTSMGELVDQLLWAAELDQDPPPIDHQIGDLAAEVRAAVDQQQGLAVAKSITMDAVTDLGSVLAQFDWVYLRQILANLISNAIKYTQPGGTIKVGIELEDDQAITITVTDDGQGLTADDMKEMFRKYARLSATPTGGERSTGLGLYIVKKLVEAMGGTVSAHSPGKHQGTTFSVHLPVGTTANGVPVVI